MTMFITKTLSTSTSCMTTAMNAFGCFPGSDSFPGTMLYATALSGTAGPFCNWSCGCGIGMAPHVTIDGSDGLPVELMDFEIAESGSFDGAQDEGENTASD